MATGPPNLFSENPWTKFWIARKICVIACPVARNAYATRGPAALVVVGVTPIWPIVIPPFLTDLGVTFVVNCLPSRSYTTVVFLPGKAWIVSCIFCQDVILTPAIFSIVSPFFKPALAAGESCAIDCNVVVVTPGIANAKPRNNTNVKMKLFIGPAKLIKARCHNLADSMCVSRGATRTSVPSASITDASWSTANLTSVDSSPSQ